LCAGSGELGIGSGVPGRAAWGQMACVPPLPYNTFDFRFPTPNSLFPIPLDFVPYHLAPVRGFLQ